MSKKSGSKRTKVESQDAEVDPRRLVGISAERVTNISSTDFPGHYPDEDNSWSHKKFKKNLKVEVKRLSQRSIEFDLVGVDASIANAFRRIMIAEVPTVCIEEVYVFDNTGVIVDEVLSHRIGLVPLNVDPSIMSMKESGEAQATDQNTIVFKLELECSWHPSMQQPSKDKGKAPAHAASQSSATPSTQNIPDNMRYVNYELLSGHLVWKPVGEQETVFGPNEASNPQKPGPINPNIVLAKLRPGQGVKMELYAVKGVGKDHAKFSPVATATYRLLPHIKIKKPIPRESVEKFKTCFAPGVIKVDSRTNEVSVDKVAVRKDWVSREVLRHPEFEGVVELGRVRDHFLFNVESESAYAPERLLPEAIKVMREKLASIKRAAEMLAVPSASELIEVEKPQGADVSMQDA
ncbi:RBP11-like subunits of RNA polymerase [Pluteus cervinus]|uniref:RBP11-like subunits of RNA polymerase n=1 Tax=Pluteus cervinus TaxID=181527 RepID=A0ACD3AGH2_9AGAR|nr:RBP11-like subunits of RNA polymerase [Pluteus cervinus]